PARPRPRPLRDRVAQFRQAPDVGVSVDPGDAARKLLGSCALGRLPPRVADVQRKHLAAVRRHLREKARVRRAAQGGGGGRTAGRARHAAHRSAPRGVTARWGESLSARPLPRPEFSDVIGAPVRIRTGGLQIRSLTLYPAELRAHTGAGKNWGERRGSNPRHSEPQSDALPTELLPPHSIGPRRIAEPPASAPRDGRDRALDLGEMAAFVCP